MNFRSILLVIFSVIVWHQSEAKYAGQWSGNGEIYNRKGWSQKCENLYFDISQMCGALHLNEAVFRCGDYYKANWPGFYLEIKDNELWYEGKWIGTIDDKSIYAEIRDQAHNQIVIYSAEMRGEQLHYVQTWKATNDEDSITLEGLLSR
jgi:hypothetical protein